MAHLIPHVAEEAMEGPAAAIGVGIGLVASAALFLMTLPAGCNINVIGIGSEGIRYLCGPSGGLLADVGKAQSFSWIAALSPALLGGLMGHWLGGSREAGE
jgi:hypothetical protein